MSPRDLGGPASPGPPAPVDGPPQEPHRGLVLPLRPESPFSLGTSWDMSQDPAPCGLHCPGATRGLWSQWSAFRSQLCDLGELSVSLPQGPLEVRRDKPHRAPAGGTHTPAATQPPPGPPQPLTQPQGPKLQCPHSPPNSAAQCPPFRVLSTWMLLPAARLPTGTLRTRSAGAPGGSRPPAAGTSLRLSPWRVPV